MFGGSGLGGDSKSGDNDDLYDYSIDLNPTGAVPMTSGFGGGYQQFGNAAGGRMGSAMGGRTAMGVVPGTEWKTPMPPRANGTCTILRPWAVSSA